MRVVECPKNVPNHWVISARRVIESPKSGKMCPIGHLKSCTEHISETTGTIFMIPRPLESSQAVGVQWLGHFSKARGARSLHRGTAVSAERLTKYAVRYMATRRAYIPFPAPFGARTLSSSFLVSL